MSKPDFRVDSREIRRYFTTLSDYLVDAEVTSAAGGRGERRSMSSRPTTFFDCDGVLNAESGGPGVVRPVS